MNAVPAGLDPDLDNHDVIHGIVLPNLRTEHDTLQSRKGEYTDEESRQIDMTGLVMEMNHNDDMLPVGRTIAYTVNPQPNGVNAAEAVFKLNREPDEPNDADPLAVVTALQRNLLMSGYHKDLSLGHETAKWNAHVDVNGVVKASADPYQPAVTYVKYHKEISTCNKGRRPGSHIKGYYPCARSLRRSDEEAIRSFANIYGYEPPPRGAHRGSKAYDAYLAKLHGEVRQRRTDALRQSNFTPILRARGFHAASADAKDANNNDDVPVMCSDDLYLTQVAAGMPTTMTSANQQQKQQQPTSTAGIMNNGNTNSSTAPADTSAAGTGNQSFSAPNAGAGGLGNGNTSAQPGNPPQSTQQQQQQQQPSAKGVASTALVTPPTEGEKIDPYDAAARFNAAFLAERKKNEDMAAKLASYEKAETDKQQKAEQERAALAAKAADEEKVQFAEKKKRMLAVINQAMEGLMKNSGGALSAADVASVGAPLASSLEKSTTSGELQAIHNGLGPVIELAMKACMGARHMEEANKQRELAAELANLNRSLAQPLPSALTFSGNANYGASWAVTPPTFQMPPAETTEHKASLNIFDRTSGGAFQTPPAFGSAGVASSTPATHETTTASAKAPETIDLNEPGYAWKLAQEFNTHTPGYLCSEKYVRAGGIEWTEKYVNSNGRVHVQKVPQARRAQLSHKKPITLRDIDKADFDSFVAEINERLKNPNQGAPYKDIVGMTVPSANYGDLVKAGLMKRFQPMEGDLGVTFS